MNVIYDEFEGKEKEIPQVAPIDLLAQIDEFRQKAELLQSAMQSRETKAKELEALVYQKQVEANELEQVIAEREEQSYVFKQVIRQEMQGMTNTFQTNMQEMEQKVDDYLKLAESRGSHDLDEKLDEKLERITDSLSDLASRLDQLEENTERIPDAVHQEGVQVYRNTSELIKTLSEKMERANKKVNTHVGKAKGAAIAATIFSILSCLGIAFVALVSLGIIWI